MQSTRSKTMSVIHKAGTRKSAIARVTLRKGTGKVRYNSLALELVHNAVVREKIEEPLVVAGGVSKKVDISVKTHGGGVVGQAEAARSAIARALAEFDKKLRGQFMDYDRSLLVPDVRRKETHKPNRHGKARGKVQKSYR
jgi:small subunit ribosomal protein S9